MATSSSPAVEQLEVTVDAPPGDEAELRRLVKDFDTDVEAFKDYYIAGKRARDFYDGEQWSAEELQELENRKQPASVFNHIAPKINYILGTEIATRVDPEVKPQTKAHETESESVTDILRYYSDHIDFDSIRSDVFENMLIEGAGACVFEPKIRQNRDGKPEVDITCRHVEWDRLVFDHMSKRRDFADSRRFSIVLWMDLEEALAHPVYGLKAKELNDAVQGGADTTTEETIEDNPQEWSLRDPARVRIVQMYYKRGNRWVEAHFCGTAFLVAPRWVTLIDEDGNSYCPMVVAASFRTRRRSNRMAEPYGVVKNLISPQEMINKGRSKAMHLLTMRQIWAEDGVFTGDCAQPAHLLQQVAKPDGYVTVRPKALVEGAAKVESNLELAAAQVQMLAEAKAEIDATGPSAPVIAGDQRVRSGRAEQQRAESGSKELAPMFESMRKWTRRCYKIMWWMVRQFCPEERWLAVEDTKERVGYRFVALNRRMTRKERFVELLKKQVPLPEAVRSVGIQPVEADELLAQAVAAAQQQVQQQAMMMQQQTGQQAPPEALQGMMQPLVVQLITSAPRMQEEFTYNDVGRLDVDIKLTESPETPVVRQEQFDKIMEVAGTGFVKIPPEVIIEASELRDKRTLREMVKAPPPDPIQQQIQKIQLAMAQAEVEKKRAETVDTLAHAEQRKADAAFKVGPMAEKTTAQALEHAASAGGKTA